jgi:hypothetical protein
VIDRFKLCVSFLLILMIKIVSLPTVANATVEIQVGRVDPNPELSKEQNSAQLLEKKAQELTLERLREIPSSLDVNLPEPTVQNIPLQPLKSQQSPLPSQKSADPTNLTAELVVPGKQNLAELIGKPEISVLADVDGQFVKNISEIPSIGKEVASTVDDANLLASVRAGRSFSRENLAALARTEQAKAQTGQAFALLLPSVAARASYGSETSSPSVEVNANGDLVASSSHMRTD